MLDLTKTYCLKSNLGLPITIKCQITESMLTEELKKKFVEVGDYVCQWIDKKKPMIDYYKEHQLQEYSNTSGFMFMG